MRLMLMSALLCALTVPAISCKSNMTVGEWVEQKVLGIDPLATKTPREKGEMLTDPDVDVRREAIQSLARDARASEPKFKARIALIFMDKLREEPDPIMRALIINELADFAGRTASRAYIEALVDTSATVRADAARALRRVKEDAAVVYLQKMAKSDRSIQVRQEAIRAVGELAPSEEAIPFLAELARSPSDEVSVTARLELSRLDPKTYPAPKTKPLWQLW